MTSYKDDNYYDIQIKSSKKANKSMMLPPKRLNSQSNLTSMDTVGSVPNLLSKRPSDYYIQKLSNSSLNLAKRPISGDSILLLNSNYSDEISVQSSNFDPHDSRLSSLTSHSIMSSSNSPNLNHYKEESLNESLATITSDMPNASIHSNDGVGSISDKSFSTTSLSLTRTKTKYLSQAEIKNRQKLRKKQYDDSYNEDELLSNDLSLVFNVPVIKNQSELYFKKGTRNNIIDDNYKPFPLPGKLRSNSTPNLKPINTSFNSSCTKVNEEDTPQTFNTTTEDLIDEEDISVNDEDSEIITNLTSYYDQRSKSYSKLVQMSRHDDMMYKLPKYVKSQSSIEDLNLISPEKLTVLDQTRPINLPPKSSTDKVKHNKELKKMFKDMERTSIVDDKSIKNDEWSDLLNDKTFNKRVIYEKNIIRKLNWDSNCTSSERYTYFIKLLTINNSDTMKKLHERFNELKATYTKLNESMKTNRSVEFNKLIDNTVVRPLFKSNLTSDEDIEEFRSQYLELLFLKSINNSLYKHDEIFLIPIIIIMFRDLSVEQHFNLIELINNQVFTKDLITEVNGNFENWNTKLPRKVDRFLDRINLSEFNNLNILQFFEIMMQFNDKSPLSISASLPSTPIIGLSPLVSSLALRSSFSCSLELTYKFFQLMLVYNLNNKTKLINQVKIFQSLLVTIVKYYHINWLDFTELIKSNKSIKLNFNLDNLINLNNFNDKWKYIFKNL